jgi:hypothetical protein
MLEFLLTSVISCNIYKAIKYYDSDHINCSFAFLYTSLHVPAVTTIYYPYLGKNLFFDSRLDHRIYL